MDTGIDAVTLGGTKNGMMCGEAVIFFKKDVFTETEFLLKRSMQLASKMRFISSQFVAMMNDGLGYKIAAHSNAMAKLLVRGLMQCPGVRLTQPPDTNAVFAVIPTGWNSFLEQQFDFYVWDDSINEIRLMCSFDTTAEDVENCISAFIKISNQ
jgi:threonine aldolase